MRWEGAFEIAEARFGSCARARTRTAAAIAAFRL